jgi:hypothetical protein
MILDKFQPLRCIHGFAFNQTIGIHDDKDLVSIMLVWLYEYNKVIQNLLTWVWIMGPLLPSSPTLLNHGRDGAAGLCWVLYPLLSDLTPYGFFVLNWTHMSHIYVWRMTLAQLEEKLWIPYSYFPLH